MKWCVLLLMLATSAFAQPALYPFAQPALYPFAQPQQQQQFQELLTELRCVVCQNQNLNDSNATVAKDLRDEVYRLVNEGKNKQQVKDYLVQRYGDFVLFKPPMQANTSFLWLFPFIGLLMGMFIWLRCRHD